MYKSWIKNLLKLVLSTSLLIMITVYVIDPYQHYRLATWYEMTSHKKRDIMPGIAKNENFDSAIVGSSMTENFSASQMSKLFDSKSIRLCVSGITSYEMNQLLHTLFTAHPNLENLIISLDLHAYSGHSKRTRNKELPLYLYDEYFFNDIKYLLNFESFRQSIKVLKKIQPHGADFDKLWYSAHKHTYTKESALHSYHKAIKEPLGDVKLYDENNMLHNFKSNILPFMKKFPNTQFYLFYPPYSHLSYKYFKKQGWLHNASNFKRHLYDTVSSYQNVRVFDFQCNTEITTNLDNYKDISHYTADVNTYMLVSMQKGNWKVSNQNIDTCIDTIFTSATQEIKTEL